MQRANIRSIKLEKQNGQTSSSQYGDFLLSYVSFQMNLSLEKSLQRNMLFCPRSNATCPLLHPPIKLMVTSRGALGRLRQTNQNFSFCSQATLCLPPTQFQGPTFHLFLICPIPASIIRGFSLFYHSHCPKSILLRTSNC